MGRDFFHADVQFCHGLEQTREGILEKLVPSAESGPTQGLSRNGVTSTPCSLGYAAVGQDLQGSGCRIRVYFKAGGKLPGRRQPGTFGKPASQYFIFEQISYLDEDWFVSIEPHH
jgi:hypothetical protein